MLNRHLNMQVWMELRREILNTNGRGALKFSVRLGFEINFVIPLWRSEYIACGHYF